MSNSSILGGDSTPSHASGKDVDALGPSDTSDSGSDVQGEHAMATEGSDAGEWGSLTVDGRGDSDALGTGERGSATGDSGRDGADILPDRIIEADASSIDDDDIDDDAVAARADSSEVETISDDEEDDEVNGDIDDPDADGSIEEGSDASPDRRANSGVGRSAGGGAGGVERRLR